MKRTYVVSLSEFKVEVCFTFDMAKMDVSSSYNGPYYSHLFSVTCDIDEIYHWYPRYNPLGCWGDGSRCLTYVDVIIYHCPDSNAGLPGFCKWEEAPVGRMHTGYCCFNLYFCQGPPVYPIYTLKRYSHDMFQSLQLVAIAAFGAVSWPLAFCMCVHFEGNFFLNHSLSASSP